MGRLKKFNVYSIVISAFLLALSLILHYVEGFIPTIVAVPGFRWGLANLPLVFTLYYYGFYYYFVVYVLKIILTGLIISGFGPAFLLSLGGGILALIFSFITYKVIKTSIYANSITSSIAHAIGQLVSYAILFETPTIFLYLVVLAPLSAVTGFLIALIDKVLISRLPKAFKESEKKRRF